jgi:tetratricopeptide (TPR) repeat protein
MRIKALTVETTLILLFLSVVPSAVAKAPTSGESTLAPTDNTLFALSAVCLVTILVGVLLYFDSRRRRYERAIEISLQEMRALMFGEISRVTNVAKLGEQELIEMKVLNVPGIESSADKELSVRLLQTSNDLKKNIEELDDTFSKKLEVVAKTVAKHTQDFAKSVELQRDLIDAKLLQERKLLTEALCVALLSDNPEDRAGFLTEFLSNSSDAKFLLRLYEKSPQLSVMTILQLTAKKLQMEERKLVIQWMDELITLDKPEIAAQIACAWIKMNFELGGPNAHFDEIYEHLPALRNQMRLFDRVEEFGDHLISRAALGHDIKQATHELFSVISSREQLLALQKGLDLMHTLLVDPAVFFTENNRSYDSDLVARTQRCIQKALRVAMTRENRLEANLLSETLAATYVLQKNFDAAKTVCRALTEISDLTLGDRSRYFFYLGAVLAFQNQSEESETMLRKSVAALDELTVSEVLLTALERLGTFYTMRGEYGHAEPLYQRVLELRHKTSGQQNNENVRVLMKLGDLCVLQNDLPQAEIFMESAVDIARAIHKPGSKPLNDVLTRYSKLLADLDKPDESKTILDSMQAPGGA